MSYHHGWLHLVEGNGNVVELFNHARTAAYLTGSSVLGCGQIYNVVDDGGCEMYRWVPPETSAAVQSAAGACFGVKGDTWFKQDFADPVSDPAPWYNANVDESGEALGFWITEWTGLDDGHISRTSTKTGLGSSLGLASASGRQMGFEVILFGESEEALEYLFRWLSATLTSVCQTCASDTLLIRRTCPTINCADVDESAAKGVVELRDVGLLSGVVWGASPIERAGCHLRRVNFTLEAQDPCMYAPCTDVVVTQEEAWEACFAAADVDPNRATCRPDCTELTGDCRITFDFDVDVVGAAAPVLTLTAPPATLALDGTVIEESLPVRVMVYENPDGAATADDVCGLPLLAELYVLGLPPGADFTYDMARRTVTIADGSGYRDGWAWTSLNDEGIPRWAALGCGTYMVVVEPATLCLTEVANLEAGVPDATVYAVEPDGAQTGIVIGGAFADVGSVTRNGWARLTRNGAALDSAVTSGVAGSGADVFAVAVQSDGRIILGGDFTTYNGTTVNNICRIWPDGTLDATFNVGGTVGTNGTVYAIAIDANGDIVIGGTFTTARGTTQNRLARLNGVDGTLDTTFNTGGTVGASSYILAIAIQDDGQIVVGGGFTAIRGTTKNQIARLNTDGTVEASWNTGGTVGVNSDVNAVAIDANGDIVIGGAFATARGTTVNRIARLAAADGTLDTTWNTGGTVGVDGAVQGIDFQSDGSVIVGGFFTNARGVTANGLARLDGVDGSLDTTFNTGGTVGAQIFIYGVAVRFDDSILIGGGFTAARGDTNYPYLALLDAVDGTVDTSFYDLPLYREGTGFPSASMQLRERLSCP